MVKFAEQQQYTSTELTALQAKLMELDSSAKGDAQRS
jgi:hypothetical protein